MELKLYNYLRKEGLTHSDVDFRETVYQDKLELYDTTLGLDVDILSSVQKHLKTYNTYLKTNQQQEVALRYYQILALYFTELYLTKKEEHDFEYKQEKEESLAYWMATGSGKTIIMHLNILQYIAHCKNFRDFEIIMTTPGVNLIDQHERELTPFIEFLNTKYRNTVRLTIDTTSALLNKPNDFFDFPQSKSYRRLILVDEAHIGLSTTGTTGTDGAFMMLRKRLNIENSFLFEYSATFHNISGDLEKDYEKSIVYDYNYNLFYKDGYGKDYYFQQVGDDVLEKSFDDNLHRNLSVINEKIDLWHNIDYSVQKDIFKASQHPDKPLIAFMGNTVNNKDKSAKNEDPEVSDITNIVNFLADLSDEQKATYKYLFNEEFAGKLTLTRNPETDDEILISYGNGGYWGIVNVGNGAKFINDLENDNVIKNPRDKVIVSNIERYSFKNIDSQNSPINVLIGSRKFAEGWNCFRVSVIGLINLGSSKGNKIIQIFGRGVRIKGLKNNGKRTFPEHNEDYFKLKNTKEEDKLRKIETLTVFSLKKSYLETFTGAVNKELEIVKKYEIEVNPSIIKLNDNTEIKFEEFRKRIPIFKLSKVDIAQRRVSLLANNSFKVKFNQNGSNKEDTVNNFSINLDYRPDRNTEGVNIKGELENFIKYYSVFINLNKLQNIISEFQEDNGLYINANSKQVTIIDVLNYINEINYKSSIDTTNIEFIENIVIQVTTDFLKKLKNKVNWYINNSNYQYQELLNQSTDKVKGDFIDKYYILKTIESTKESRGKTTFKKQKEIDKEVTDFENEIDAIAESLKIDTIGNHIYNPLLREVRNNVDGEKDLKITPDKLNAGEKKFVQDCANYFKDNKDFKDYEIYLMRNVETLKSIGIYLNDDSQVFYPDFILWMIKEDTIHINFIDPKGQMGIQDATTLLDNEKVKIANKANNDTLVRLEKELSETHNKTFILNSFLLLRDSSVLGFNKPKEWIKEKLIDKNIFRLNWHETDERENKVAVDKLPDNKSYLDLIVDCIN
ncbi:DEAD/DEAH box helicase family protein [Psychroserpens ponticola]|uniref:DEAD/DEAH box helicase family protein n=1 Tax=Psychroserpens ponticola TaxID=2932268 RepID=A0ABY7S192_9FLAO|nr:DEAD/DEAH box helicase family protein [Psychroserpens ponticola]WCO02908.1 DEAD/DEAH box helicase family protein [Psychroserpens ponticola]